MLHKGVPNVSRSSNWFECCSIFIVIDTEGHVCARLFAKNVMFLSVEK